MSLVENERLKLTAGYFNTGAAAIMVTGVVAPMVALSYGLSGPAGGWQAFLISLIWLFWSGVIHLFARGLLKRLQP